MLGEFIFFIYFLPSFLFTLFSCFSLLLFHDFLPLFFLSFFVSLPLLAVFLIVFGLRFLLFMAFIFFLSFSFILSNVSSSSLLFFLLHFFSYLPASLSSSSPCFFFLFIFFFSFDLLNSCSSLSSSRCSSLVFLRPSVSSFLLLHLFFFPICCC